jgi:dolichyl-diphosphooligosaccharide--protein glycosyltransferase
MRNQQSQNLDQSDRNYNSIHRVALILVVLLAVWIRMDDLISWNEQPHRAFYNGQPILINYDGYYYLSLARDLLHQAYEPMDDLRGVPDSQKRPMPPPLISVFAAGIAAISPFSLDWIAAVLPVFLGVLLAVPLYLFSRLYGGPLMAVVTVIMGLCAKYYVYRSSIGWFDTDCLNVTFALLSTYFFLRFGMEVTARRYIYLVTGLMVYILFLLWWDQTRTAVSLITICPLAMVLVLYYRPQGRERWLAAGAGAIGLIGLLFWHGPQFFLIPFEKAMEALGYITKTQVGDFPNTALSVMEQKRVGLTALAQGSTGSLVTFLIGIAGLFWLLQVRKRQAVPLMVLFGLGCFSIFFARRFLIFLNPFLAIGLGFIAQQLWNYRSRWSFLRYAAPLGAALVCLIGAKDSLRNVYWPKVIPPIVEGMQILSDISPPDALIWAWWDHGYALRYWSQRATINDGSLHNGPRTVSNAIPLSSVNPQQAANFMYFYAARGWQGIQKVIGLLNSSADGMHLLETIFRAGPEHADSYLVKSGLTPLEQWRTFFFPPRDREINLFVDLRVARTAYWWHWFGTWDMASNNGVHGMFQLFRNCRLTNDNLVGSDLSVDLARGIVQTQQRKYPLVRFYHNDGQQVRRIEYKRAKGLVFVFRQPSRVGALMDRDFSETIFNQLYMFENSDLRYFTLKAHYFPYYQIWQVKPDPVHWTRQAN